MSRIAITRLLGFGLGLRAPVSVAAANRGYHPSVLDDFLRNAGSFNKEDPSVGTGEILRFKDPSVGTGIDGIPDSTKIQIKVDDATGKIVDACHETVGCRIDYESSYVVTEWAKGKNIEEVISIDTKEISKLLFPPLTKLHPLLFQLASIKGREDLDSLKDAEDAINRPEFAIKSAVQDYKEKKAKAASENYTAKEGKSLDYFKAKFVAMLENK